MGARPPPPRQGRSRQRVPRRLRLGARARLRRHRPARRRPLAPAGDPAARCRRRSSHGADLVLGSRYVPGGGSVDWPLHRQVFSKRRLRPLVARARPALLRPLRRLQALARVRARGRSMSPRRARRATSSRSRRRSARTAPRLRIIEIPFTFRDRTAGESKMRAVDRARGRAHGRAPAPRRAGSLSAWRRRSAPARSRRRRPASKRCTAPSSSAARPVLALVQTGERGPQRCGELGVAADQRDGRARHAAEPRDARERGQRGIGAQLEREHASSRSARASTSPRMSARSELWWLPVRTQS